MENIKIPCSLDDSDAESSRRDVQEGAFQRRRESILTELRSIPGIIDAAKTLNPDTTYKIVCWPERGKLFRDSAGNLQAVFYKDGKIVQHARLRALSPSLVKAATAIGSQILLIHIALELSDIKKKIEKLADMQHEDRQAEIYSGVALYEQACLVENSTTRVVLISNAIQSLNTDIERTFKSLERQISEMPDTEPHWRENWPFQTLSLKKQPRGSEPQRNRFTPVS